jgi:DNA-binding NtrC family response regulator
MPLAEGCAMFVLVVDDEAMVRDIIAEGLQDEGFHVAEAATAEEALTLSARREPPEVVVTDVRLGDGMDGIELVGEVHRQWPDVGIVIITGQPAAVREYRLTSRERLLYKPFDYSTLVHAVRQVMGEAAR